MPRQPTTYSTACRGTTTTARPTVTSAARSAGYHGNSRGQPQHTTVNIVATLAARYSGNAHGKYRGNNNHVKSRGKTCRIGRRCLPLAGTAEITAARKPAERLAERTAAFIAVFTKANIVARPVENAAVFIAVFTEGTIMARPTAGSPARPAKRLVEGPAERHAETLEELPAERPAERPTATANGNGVPCGPPRLLRRAKYVPAPCE